MSNYETPNTEDLDADEIEDAVVNKRGSINPSASAYDQGWAEALDWVSSLFKPVEEETDDDEDDDDDTEPEPEPTTKSASSSSSSIPTAKK